MLEVEDLHVYYGQVHAVKGVSLQVADGQVVTLIGANGAGKSTTIKAIAGLVPARRGRITLNGSPLSGRRPEEVVALGVGYVPEGRRVFPFMSVEDNLLVGAFTRRDAAVRRDLEAIYHRFENIGRRRRALAGTLSGGEQQMLAIGRALMSRPRLLLMDEPSLGLAPALVDAVFDLIRHLNRDEGTTILLVEQNARGALEVAHRGVVLETGSVALAGAAAELMADPRVRKVYMGM